MTKFAYALSRAGISRLPILILNGQTSVNCKNHVIFPFDIFSSDSTVC